MVQDPLLPVARNPSHIGTSHKCFKRKCCIKSKAAILILLWNFAILLAYKMLYDINNIMQVGETSLTVIILFGPMSVFAIFAPISGLFTDVKFSRYKAVTCSSCTLITLIFSTPLIAIVSSLIYTVLSEEHVTQTKLLRLTSLCPSVFLGFLIIAFTIFSINALQFGMDQLHDLSTEDSILFIHWHVWIYYLSSFITDVIWNLSFLYTHHLTLGAISITGYALTLLTLIGSLTLLIISHCIVHRKKTWFYFEPAGINPYKLVYRIVKFAYQHKVPLRRSAFTYCGEDEFPSRIDFGKHKIWGTLHNKAG